MFRRRSAEPADSAALDDDYDSAPVLPGQESKGRPTPKRKEAQAARKQRLSAPKTRKEANAVRREQTREASVKRRAALSGDGDARYLPVRDQGPVRRFVRDFVDSRRTLVEFALPVVVVFFLLELLFSGVSPFLGTVFWVILVGAIVVDEVRVVRGVRRAVAERFDPSEVKGITFYAAMRAMQFRRMRMPKPNARAGDTIT